MMRRKNWNLGISKLDPISKEKGRKNNVVSFSRKTFLFLVMDQLDRWQKLKDTVWAKKVGLSGLEQIQLQPFRSLIQFFFCGVMRYNPEKIEAEIRGISVVITTKFVGKMLHLLVAGIHTPPTILKDKAHKLCLKFIDQEFWNQKEGWRVFGFRGKYLLQMLAFM